MRQRRLAGAMIAVPALLVLAVVGAGWDTMFDSQVGESSSREDVALSTPGGLDFRPFAVLLVIALACLLYFMLRHRGIIAMGIVLTFMVVIALFALFGGGLARDDNAPVLPEEEIGGDSDAEPDPAGDPAWMLIVAFGALAVLGAGAVLLRSTRADPSADESDEVGGHVAALADRLDTASGNPRRAIIAMYASLEHLLAGEGRHRDDSETTAEFSSRVLLQLGARGGPCEELAALYQRVAFGENEARDDDRDRAVGLLRSISADVSPATESVVQ